MKITITDLMLNQGLDPGNYTDAACPGLRLVVYDDKRNVRHYVWYTRYRNKLGGVGKKYISDKQGEYYPNMRKGDPRKVAHVSIHEAHVRCHNARQANRDGGKYNPNGANRTLAQDMEDWLARVLTKGDKRPEHQVKMRRDLLTRYVPQLLERRTMDIDPRDNMQALDNIVTVIAHRPGRTRPTNLIKSAERTRGYLRELFRHAMGVGKFAKRWPPNASNPVDDRVMHMDLGRHEERQQPALALDDVQMFYAKLIRATEGPTARPYHSAYAQRLVMEGLSPRINEAAQAKWEQFHLDGPTPEWHVPDANIKVHKRKRPVLIRPLNRHVVAMLRRLRPANAKPTDYVFPYCHKGGRYDYTRPMRGHSALQYIRGMGEETATTHGMRTFLTNLVVKIISEGRPEDQTLMFALNGALDHEQLGHMGDKYRTEQFDNDMRKLANLVGDFLNPEIPLIPPPRMGRHGPRISDAKYAQTLQETIHDKRNRNVDHQKGDQPEWLVAFNAVPVVKVGRSEGQESRT